MKFTRDSLANEAQIADKRSAATNLCCFVPFLADRPELRRVPSGFFGTGHSAAM